MKKPTFSVLKKRLWKERSEFIRNRDTNSEGMGKCMTCQKIIYFKDADAGHYYSRAHDYTTALLIDDRNVNLQCGGCNRFQSGRQPEYALALEKKYGEGTLQDMARNRMIDIKWRYSDIEKFIENYKKVNNSN